MVKFKIVSKSSTRRKRKKRVVGCEGGGGGGEYNGDGVDLLQFEERAVPAEDVIIATATQDAEAECQAARKLLPIDMDMVREESDEDDTLQKLC
ncbi:hypothetical protein Y032_0024g1047 [Ancylostoma ceylanicum]|uniref:Uncharacterized protein n=1 Tax=Ancylostoma ceylanicum TaxID=53326 RepID=A0A016UX60_9BILA|nr:hypothetical protein Y032_0024g1047 [Ancylostoma ceylanicum]